eukprot:1682693-Prymnesium_polylepis.1
MNRGRIRKQTSDPSNTDRAVRCAIESRAKARRAGLEYHVRRVTWAIERAICLATSLASSAIVRSALASIRTSACRQSACQWWHSGGTVVAQGRCTAATQWAGCRTETERQPCGLGLDRGWRASSCSTTSGSR